MYKSYSLFFFFQAEDGIRDAQESRGLGDVYKRQLLEEQGIAGGGGVILPGQLLAGIGGELCGPAGLLLSLIHI